MASKGIGRRAGGAVAAVVGALWLAWGLSGPVVSARDEGKPSAGALPADLDRVPRDAAGFLSVRVADVWNGPYLKGIRARLAKETPDTLAQMEKQMGATPGEVERLTFVLADLVPGSEPVVLVATTKRYDKTKILKLARARAKVEKFAGHTLYVAANDGLALCLLSDRVYLFGGPQAVKVFLERPATKKEGPLSDALAAAAKKHVGVIGVNGEAVAKAVKMLPRELPPQARPFLPLVKARQATLVFDLGDEVRGEGRVLFASEKEARAGEKSVQALLTVAQAGLAEVIKYTAKQKGAGALVEMLRKMDSSLKKAKVEQKGETLRAMVAMKVDTAVIGTIVAEAVQKMRGATARAQSQNNLKQLAIAMHNYASAYGHFPPGAIYDKDGKPGLSWRVQLLPYLEQNALYDKFHLDEPWDSAHNKKLLKMMPKVFATPEDDWPTTKTHFLAFTGKSTIFDGKKGIRLPTDIPDGTSNTIMFVQAAKAVPWTKPEDLPFDPTKPLPKLGINPTAGFLAAMCDGSVRFFPAKIKPANLKAWITRDGGEVVSDE